MQPEIEKLRTQTQRIVAALADGHDGAVISGMLAERERYLRQVVEMLHAGAEVDRQALDDLRALEDVSIEMMQTGRDVLYAAIAACRDAHARAAAYRKAQGEPNAVQLDSAA